MNGRVCVGFGFWSRQLKSDRRPASRQAVQRAESGLSDDGLEAWPTGHIPTRSHTWVPQARERRVQINTQEGTMNSIIYIVGLVVIIGAVLGYFGFR